jgi:membrane associated rhomboid family serine protease
MADLVRTEPSSPRDGAPRERRGPGRWTGVLWVIAIVNAILGGSLAAFGIHPHTLVGLLEIPLAPFLHAGFFHLLANTIPFLVLGALTMGRKRMDFYVVSVVSAITAGLGAWFFGASGSVHLGASGVIFGYLGFLLARGIYERSAATIALSLFCGWIFGSMLWGVLPSSPRALVAVAPVRIPRGILTARQLGLEASRAGLVR